jgi:RNA polymerase sigma-70 factor (ECF subfamily)
VARDADALARLYDRDAARAFGFLVRLVRDRAWAEDLLHDAFLRVARHLDELRDPAAARTYLFRAASNLAIDGLRARRRAVAAMPESARAAARRPRPDGAATAEARDEADAVRRALDRVPDRERVALTLRVVEGFGWAEIADVLDLSDRGAARLVRVALDRLRRRLCRDETDDARPNRRNERAPLRS